MTKTLFASINEAVDHVHREIADAAIPYANQLAVERGLVEAGHSPFTQRAGLQITLVIDEAFAIDKDQQWHDAMADAATEAVAKVLAKKKYAERIVGLAVGLARHGRNYFEEIGS